MEQRPLRLGDIVDDYCARERRITNHAIVAIVEDAIRQTRCTTCDAEHPYKGAREPRLRKKPGASEELYDQVLADVNGARTTTPPTDEASLAAAAQSDSESDSEPGEAEDAPSQESSDGGEPGHEIWPGHRRLIRATLPRSENEPPPPRPIPEFTMHQRPQGKAPRPFRFRGPSNANGNGNGNGYHGGPGGFGQGHSSRPGRHRGKKRPR